MAERAIQAKDLDGDLIVELIRDCNEARCDYTVENAARGWGAWHGGRPGYGEGDDNPPIGHPAKVIDLESRVRAPRKVLLAKLQRLIDQGRISGCTCGCRGDFEAAA
jgi:hypothetical protein